MVSTFAYKHGVLNSKLFHSSTDRLLSDPDLSAAESPLADKKAPGSERAAERAAAAQQNSERARLAPRPSYVNMQVMRRNGRVIQM